MPVLRLPSAELTERAVDCLAEAGFSTFEITLTTPDAIALMRKLSRFTVGAGTVLDLQTARQCLDAGAQFLVSPGLIPGLGADGVLVSDGARQERIPGIQVKALDATGAGDCFCGAALARLAAGDSVWQAARYANAAAALATTGFGAVDPLPRPAAVEAPLRAGG